MNGSFKASKYAKPLAITGCVLQVLGIGALIWATAIIAPYLQAHAEQQQQAEEEGPAAAEDQQAPETAESNTPGAEAAGDSAESSDAAEPENEARLEDPATEESEAAETDDASSPAGEVRTREAVMEKVLERMPSADRERFFLVRQIGSLVWLASLFTLSLSLFTLRYRAKWFYIVLVAFGALWLVTGGFRSFLGIGLLIYLLFAKDKFLKRPEPDYSQESVEDGEYVDLDTENETQSEETRKDT